MIEDDTDSKFKSEFIQELKKMSHDKLLKYKSAAIILSSFIDIIAVLIILFMFIFPKFLIISVGCVFVFLFALISYTVGKISGMIREQIASRTDK